MNDKPTRRTLLKHIGTASVLGTLAASGTASADPSTTAAGGGGAPGVSPNGRDRDLPVEAQGQTIRQYRPVADGFEVHERFVSPALEQRYGTRVVEFDPELVPATTVPDRYSDPARPFTVQFSESAVIGSNRQHANAEDRLRAGSDGVTTQSHSYDGPLYVYQSGSAAQTDDVSKRTGPINLNWTDSLNRDAGDVKQFMRNRGWTACCAFYSGTRYILDDGSPKPQDAHIYQGIDYTKQYHIRVYDVGVYDSFGTEVVGQIHKDPYDHNTIGDAPWYFDESRDQAENDWDRWGFDTQYYCTCATQWSTHDGNMAVIST